MESSDVTMMKLLKSANPATIYYFDEMNAEATLFTRSPKERECWERMELEVTPADGGWRTTFGKHELWLRAFPTWRDE